MDSWILVVRAVWQVFFMLVLAVVRELYKTGFHAYYRWLHLQRDRNIHGQESTAQISLLTLTGLWRMSLIPRTHVQSSRFLVSLPRNSIHHKCYSHSPLTRQRTTCKHTTLSERLWVDKSNQHSSSYLFLRHAVKGKEFTFRSHRRIKIPRYFLSSQ